nr:recombinase [Cyanobacteriota bacterium]
MAEFEAHRISERTREALAAAKQRGVKLGKVNPVTIKSNDAADPKADSETEQLRPILEAMEEKGATLRKMGSALARSGRTTRNGQILSA